MYPKVLTHRSNPHAQVVVDSAEQEAALPEEYRSAAATVDGATADIVIPGEADTLEQGRKQLALDREEFTRKADEARDELNAMHQQLVNDRAALDADRAALEQARADFEAQRATSTAGTGESVGDTGTVSATAQRAATDEPAPAAPAKRTRVKAEG